METYQDFLTAITAIDDGIDRIEQRKTDITEKHRQAVHELANHLVSFGMREITADELMHEQARLHELKSAADPEPYLMAIKALQARKTDLRGEWQSILRQQERQTQRLNAVAARLSRPQALLGQHSQWLDRLAHRLQAGAQNQVGVSRHRLERQQDRLVFSRNQTTQQRSERLERLALRLSSVDPHRVLERGYAWLSDATGQALTQRAQFKSGQSVHATLSDGVVPLIVKD
jgi:exonuclease VII large subunit